MRWFSIAVAAAVGASATSTGVAADDDEQKPSRFYAGLGAASLEHRVEHEGIEFTDTSAGIDLFGGFRLNDALGVEVAYKRFDDIAAQDIRGSGVTRLDIEMPLDIIVIKAVGQLSFRELFGWQRNWRVYGTAGMYQTDFERTVVNLGSGATESVRDKQSGLTVGAGMLYQLGPVDLRGYVEWLGVLDDNEASNAGVAVQFSF
jgi:opacity protein-like surface antigen